MEEANYPAVALVACGLAGIVMSLDVEGKRYGIDRIVAIDTSDRALNVFRNANQKIMIGERAAGKPKTAEQVRKLAGKHQSTIQQALDGMQLVIIVAGAAGFAGGTLATLVAEFAQRNGSLVLALVSWPFPYEPRQRRRQALITLGSLIKHANSVLPLHEPSSGLYNKSVEYVINERRTALRHYLWHVCGCLFRPKLADIDFEEIRSVFTLNTGGLVSQFGWGEASGAERAVRAVEQAISHPGLPVPERISPHSISVDIRGHHTSLSMREVAEVMDRIQAAFISPTPCTLVFSAGPDDEIGDRLQVSLIVN